MSVTVIEFISLDGIVTDPDGSAGTPAGGWAFRHGPEEVAGDKFRMGAALDDGVLMLGPRTWALFARLWPNRTDPFSTRMNAARKLVASRTLTDVSAWRNSTITTDAVGAVTDERRDVTVAGSVGLVRALMAADLVDEYRLLIFPTVVGTGDRLFPDGGPVRHLETVEVERTGAATFARYRRPAGA